MLLRLNKMPAKKRFLLFGLVVLAFTPLLAPWFGFHGDGPPGYLDAVAEGFRKNPRVTVVSVNRDAGQIVLLVPETKALLTFNAAKVDVPGPFEKWKYTWKDKQGGVVALGDFHGQPEKIIHLEVPGLLAPVGGDAVK
jgi:hypothetical protein